MRAETLDLAGIATGAADELGLGRGFEPHSCLDFILQELRRFPGRGARLIEAGLRSPVVRNRNLAAAALAGWPRADWPGGLEKSLHARDVKATHGRVPVGIVTVYIEDGQPKTDRALYLVGYSLHPRVLRSAKVELEGLSLLRRGVGEDVQKAVDAVWSRQVPAAPEKP